jgi:predicted Zn finger-like uncharacterized protein
MQTTCPECRTTFRVSQDHLGARRGLVRCGHCNAVFNAYDTLLPELEEPPAGGDVAAESVAPVAIPLVRASPETEAQSPLRFAAVQGGAVPALERSGGGHEQSPEQSGGTMGTAALELDETVQRTAAEEPIAVVVSASVDEPVETASRAETPPDILLQPLWAQPAKRQRSWQFVFSVSLAVLLVGLLVLQAAYFLRAELAAAVPMSRPALEWLCRPLVCVVPLPRQLTQDAIASSSLEHDPEQTSRVRLTFLLANRTGQTQAWPNITLTLSDVREAPVAQQVFRPKTYLPKSVKIADGMPNGGEREIRLDLDIGNLVASGYALSLTYP